MIHLWIDYITLLWKSQKETVFSFDPFDSNTHQTNEERSTKVSRYVLKTIGGETVLEMKRSGLWDNSKGAYAGGRVICANWCSSEIAQFETDASLQRVKGHRLELQWTPAASVAAWKPGDRTVSPAQVPRHGDMAGGKNRLLHSGRVIAFYQSPGRLFSPVENGALGMKTGSEKCSALIH